MEVDSGWDQQRRHCREQKRLIDLDQWVKKEEGGGVLESDTMKLLGVEIPCSPPAQGIQIPCLPSRHPSASPRKRLILRPLARF